MRSSLIIVVGLCLNMALVQGATYWGNKVTVGSGYARTYAEMQNNRPKELGVEISHEALSHLPHQDVIYNLGMPHGVSLPPYKQIQLNWNPHGHEPDGVYNKPHFDIHFYFISKNALNSITCIGEDEATCLELPEAEHVPPHYAPTPAGVPQMGWHWVDTTAPEFNGKEFSHTFIYGYYSGWPIFIEPMFTLDLLMTHATYESSIRLPKDSPYQTGYFPRSYKIHFDAKTNTHKITLKDFTNI